MTLHDAAQSLKDDFDFLTDWEERYAHIIDLGKSLAPLSADERNDANKVRGCASQVWLVTERSEDGANLIFRGESDAILVSGLIALALTVYSDQTPEAILAFNAEAFFQDLGVDDALSPQRSNGFRSMINRIRTDAERALKAQV